jgi:hypothetical protein
MHQESSLTWHHQERPGQDCMQMHRPLHSIAHCIAQWTALLIACNRTSTTCRLSFEHRPEGPDIDAPENNNRCEAQGCAKEQHATDYGALSQS